MARENFLVVIDKYRDDEVTVKTDVLRLQADRHNWLDVRWDGKNWIIMGAQAFTIRPQVTNVLHIEQGWGV